MRLSFSHLNIATNFLRRKYFKKVVFISNAKFLSTEANSNPVDHCTPVENIRNFCIIAHVDHGKSTLADRFLEMLGGMKISKENQQVLDRLPVEKERGITVKSVAASLSYTYKGTNYLLNLIDTPGHVDFSNEVNRFLFACQGVILLVDANQGVQAQTIANYYLASSKNLVVIPVLNKIDLPKADPEILEKQLEKLFGFPKSDILRISAKTGLGVENLLKTVVEKVPPPQVSRDEPFRALTIDSWFDPHRGVLIFIYIAAGEVKAGDEIVSFKEKKSFIVKSTAKLTPDEVKVNLLHAGQVGVISCNVRKIDSTLMGDTLHVPKIKVEPLQSFEPSKPMVFAGVYPQNQSEHFSLKSAIEKLCLNDPGVNVALETSPALGMGWRLGFLGLLHMDVFRQRLEQEFGEEAILTAPGVTYKVKLKRKKKNKKQEGEELEEIRNPILFPASSEIEEAYEPIVSGTIISPIEYLQAVTNECLSRRAVQDSATPLEGNRIMVKFILPLSEIIYDFHDKLKSLTSGYASFDYEHKGYMRTLLKRITILLNGREVEELTTVVHESKTREIANKLCEKLTELIPRQQVELKIQAVSDGVILVKKLIKPYRKDVMGKYHGGDVNRKLKLLRRQKESKKEMRKFFNMEIDRDTFIQVLRESRN